MQQPPSALPDLGDCAPAHGCATAPHRPAAVPPGQRARPARRLPVARARRGRSHRLRERPLGGAGPLLGGLALRDAGDSRAHGGASLRPLPGRARRPGRHPRAAQSPLRQPVRRVLPVLDVLARPAHRRREPSLLAPARLLFPAAATVGHGPEVRGRVRAGGGSAERLHAGGRRGPSPFRSGRARTGTDRRPRRRGTVRAMRSLVQRVLTSPAAGLLMVILLLGTILTLFAGAHVDRRTGQEVNNFLNSNTLVQTATDASFFAIMAVGATFVIISGGIDLSVGSVYALTGVTMALVLRALGPSSGLATVLIGLAISVSVGLVCGILNGLMVVGLPVHPFVITLGTMWILRGLAFVISRAESILVPASLTAMAKASLGLTASLYPVPMLMMIAAAILGMLYLERTVMGRHIFALGGNPEASRFARLRLGRIQLGVVVVSGLNARLAPFLGASSYGSASCGDAAGYELYVIASAVVGGASLTGGKGSAISAMLGALLIVLIRQSIRTLHLDQNYEWIVIGCAIIIAVVLDQGSARVAARRLVAAPTGGTR